jgi:LysR family transcriptional regulator, glycine cleavage system transcriptional activator
VQLFRRLNRALLLTDAGQACLPGLAEGFDRLAEAVAASRIRDEHRALAITVPPTFGARWLLSRLDRFRAAHPGIDVRIDATDRLVDFAREEVDIGIRYGAGDYPDVHVEPLLTEEVFPVCSPRLLEGPHPLRKPEDLKAHTLLHSEWGARAQPDWPMWLLAAGVHDIDASRGPQFSLAGMTIQAAIEGHGVALVGSVLVADDLAAGRLIKPFDLSVPVSFGYYMVCEKTAVSRPKIRAFCEWLRAEAREYEESQRLSSDSKAQNE